MRPDSRQSQDDVRPPQAIRLTFSLDGSAFQLVFERSVNMPVLPSADLGPDQPRARFWYEVQAKGGERLYRGFDRNPLDPWVEVATGDPERPLAFRRTERPEGFYTITVPDLDDAHSVVLFGFTPPKPGAELDVSRPPTEIARFTLAKAIGPDAAGSDLTAPLTVSNTLVNYTDSATIRLEATDNAGGSGVAHTYYKVDGGAQQEGTTVVVSTPGSHTLEFWSEDRAGNVEFVNTVTFTISALKDERGA